ncbi:hypothetical protein LAWI1_G003797 [Lachnellula willkommii]|uniref:Uncharacterized protein n=1 Tax=Lachnellula willkommii TaxID=215461 RepID=A0A559MFD5_9HELO|nr:hypothetical protein LAWI1_G003797 [Lachnellula willkommii]
MYQGQTLCFFPPWELTGLEDSFPPASFSLSTTQPGSKPRILTGIRVLGLCRVIAGPAIGRTLAEYSAQVIQLTSPDLSDGPFFQVHRNTGKHTCDLDLRSLSGSKDIEDLLQSTAWIDLAVVPQKLVELVQGRGKGIVYVGRLSRLPRSLGRTTWLATDCRLRGRYSMGAGRVRGAEPASGPSIPDV